MDLQNLQLSSRTFHGIDPQSIILERANAYHPSYLTKGLVNK